AITADIEPADAGEGIDEYVACRSWHARLPGGHGTAFLALAASNAISSRPIVIKLFVTDPLAKSASRSVRSWQAPPLPSSFARWARLVEALAQAAAQDAA